MGKSLVIVESPAKAKTINKFLGKGYEVRASMGHICDLPENRLGVDIQDKFRPQYVIIPGKHKVVSELKRAVRDAEQVLLATDPDREGEAIAWHIAERVVGGKRGVRRVLFHEITERTVRDALANPQDIDMRKVHAQQARRVLDRLVGYQVSPLLWKTIKGGLSAGRVQSVALRLVCEREEEIERFTPKEYWTITARLRTPSGDEFEAVLARRGGKRVHLPDEESARKVLEELKGLSFVVHQVLTKEVKRNPPPPFITSTLQQEAARKLGFSAGKTMRVAQGLYEGVDLDGERTGLITYMRTDSVRLAEEAVHAAREFVASSYGPKFLPQRPRAFKSRRGAQEAHEAIRPTEVHREPKKVKKFLTQDQYKLYELIWKRFLACQMAQVVLDRKTVEIKAGDCIFKATGSTVKFAGFTVLYQEAKDEDQEEREVVLPECIGAGEVLTLVGLSPGQHFTKPPPRYTEASLVKELESKGIGRPSTYAQIIGTLKEREYVVKEKGRFVATDLGRAVNALLVRIFPDIFEVGFTARMEEDLDRVEAGEEEWMRVVEQFYTTFSRTLRWAEEHRRDLRKGLQEETGEECPKCGRPLVVKWGRYGRFYACSGFPDCSYTRPLKEEKEAPQPTGERCPQCGAELLVRQGKYGRFLACSAYPKCTYSRPLGLGIPCPEPGCDGELVERRTKRGRVFYGCSNYPKCSFATWDRPVPQPCPKCGFAFLLERNSRGVSLRCLSCKAAISEEEATPEV
ncbi:MAG TPA: type I DNA topoisomerase [Candidatus Latescibacteria bacterium]|nr:type I DNA topoisomerase [Candidatus Latescibacterota bacterium]